MEGIFTDFEYGTVVLKTEENWPMLFIIATLVTVTFSTQSGTIPRFTLSSFA